MKIRYFLYIFFEIFQNYEALCEIFKIMQDCLKKAKLCGHASPHNSSRPVYVHCILRKIVSNQNSEKIFANLPVLFLRAN